MKKLLSFAIFSTLFFVSKAQQVEVKINPVGILFQRYNVSAEYHLNEHIGIDFSPSYYNYDNQKKQSSTTIFNKKGTSLQLTYKYYPFPKKVGGQLGYGIYLSGAKSDFTKTFINERGIEELKSLQKNMKASVGFLATYK
jgi:hypothetical protein